MRHPPDPRRSPAPFDFPFRRLASWLLAGGGLLLFASCRDGSPRDGPGGAAGIEGAWERVTPAPDGSGWMAGTGDGAFQVKVFAGGAFTWIRYDANGVIQGAGAGDYEIRGSNCVETPRAMADSMTDWIGEPLRFEFELRDGILRQTGTLPGGIQVEETYRVWPRKGDDG